ncbi:MAG TPA: Flp family type IVb pilin [Kofleriaceae bacterium]|nr:Flp family type IVb pilin [Kofleriaceae bacterium]
MSKRVEKSKPERRSLLRDVRGLTTVEYIIILCLIAVVGFAAWRNFGGAVKAKVEESDATVDKLPATVED